MYHKLLPQNSCNYKPRNIFFFKYVILNIWQKVTTNYDNGDENSNNENSKLQYILKYLLYMDSKHVTSTRVQTANS